MLRMCKHHIQSLLSLWESMIATPFFSILKEDATFEQHANLNEWANCYHSVFSTLDFFSVGLKSEDKQESCLV